MGKRKRQQQGKLSLEPVGASSPDTQFSTARVKYGLAAKSSPAKKTAISSLSSADKAPDQPPKKKIMMKRSHKNVGRQQTLENSLAQQRSMSRAEHQSAPLQSIDNLTPVSIDGSNVKIRPKKDQLSSPSTTISRSRSRKVVVISDDSSESAAEDNGLDGGETADIHAYSRRSTRRPIEQSPDDIASIDSMDEDDGQNHPNTSQSEALPNIVPDDGDDDSDDAPLKTPRSSFQPRLPDNDDESDDDVPLSSTRKKVAKKPRRAVRTSSSEDEEEPDVPLRRGRRLASATKSSPTKPRSARKQAHKGRRTEKQKQIELRRRRREGEDIDELTESESSEEEKPALYDPDEKLLSLDIFPDEEADEPKPQPSEPQLSNVRRSGGSRRSKSRSVRASDEGDLDDFVVHDTDGEIGIPDHLLRDEIPPQFRLANRKPLSESFKDVVDWLIQDRINPAFDRTEAAYSTAWRKVGRELEGLGHSKFTSSVWKPDFKNALEARPDIFQYELPRNDAGLMASCQACGRRSHPATWRIRFGGAPYNKETLEEIEQPSEEDSDEGTRDYDLDEKSLEIPKESAEWNVGSTCQSNAHAAHTLIHWKPFLRSLVVARLEHDGELSGAQFEARDKMNSKQRRQAIEATIDRWDEDNFILGLFNDLRSIVKIAREKPTVVKKGGKRW